MKRSAVVAAFVLFGVIAAVVAGLYFAKRAQIRRAEEGKVPHEMPGFVQVVPAKSVPFQQTADLTGTVFSRRTVRVQNEVAGTRQRRVAKLPAQKRVSSLSSRALVTRLGA